MTGAPRSKEGKARDGACAATAPNSMVPGPQVQDLIRNARMGQGQPERQMACTARTVIRGHRADIGTPSRIGRSKGLSDRAAKALRMSRGSRCALMASNIQLRASWPSLHGPRMFSCILTAIAPTHDRIKTTKTYSHILSRPALYGYFGGGRVRELRRTREIVRMA